MYFLSKLISSKQPGYDTVQLMHHINYGELHMLPKLNIPRL